MWSQLELTGIKRPVQTEVDNSDVELSTDKK